MSDRIKQMKIISLNVNGIRSAYRKGFPDWLIKEDPDVICIQEVKSNEIPSSGDLFSPNLNTLYCSVLNPASKKGYSGTAVFSKEKPKKTTFKIGLERFDTEGRFIELDFDKFSLINIYMPHGARDKKNLKYKLESYGLLLAKLQELSSKDIILTGDFNIAHKEIDLARPKENVNNIMFTSEERQQLDKIMKFGFIDSFRKFNLAGGNYTWWPYLKSARENNVGWRLDYIFASEPLSNKLESSFILKDIFLSDHCPTVAIFKL